MFKKLYYHNDKAYLINRKIPHHNFKIGEEIKYEFVEKYMKELKCDHVLKDQKDFIFVETIEEPEIKEVINNE